MRSWGQLVIVLVLCIMLFVPMFARVATTVAPHAAPPPTNTPRAVALNEFPHMGCFGCWYQSINGKSADKKEPLVLKTDPRTRFERDVRSIPLSRAIAEPVTPYTMLRDVPGEDRIRVTVQHRRNSTIVRRMR